MTGDPEKYQIEDDDHNAEFYRSCGALYVYEGNKLIGFDILPGSATQGSIWFAINDVINKK